MNGSFQPVWLRVAVIVAAIAGVLVAVWLFALLATQRGLTADPRIAAAADPPRLTAYSESTGALRRMSSGLDRGTS